LIIHSRSKPAFCAGADLRELVSRRKKEKGFEKRGCRWCAIFSNRIIGSLNVMKLRRHDHRGGASVTFCGRLRVGADCDFDYRRQNWARFCFPGICWWLGV